MAIDFDAEMTVSREQQFELEDGEAITLNDELFRCGEVFFNPALIGSEVPSVAKMVVDSISKCTITARKDLYENIVLAGGSTLFKGFPERLQKEIQLLVPKSIKVKVFADEDRKYTAAFFRFSIHYFAQ